MHVFLKSLISPFIFFVFLTRILNAQEPNKQLPSFEEAIRGGKFYIDLRLRHELVDQETLSQKANATTIRTKLGYQSAGYKGFSGTIEFEHSAEILGGEYNNGINGKGYVPAIIDANHTEFNQGYLSYHGLTKTMLALGRQALNLGNERFVGSVGWRQNDQTYDMASIINNSVEGLTVFYGYVWNVNRIFGDDHPLGNLKTKSHFINVNYNAISNFDIEGYGYLIDFDKLEVRGLNSKTFGIRGEGSHKIYKDINILYALEYANQTNYGLNSLDFSVDYFQVETGIKLNSFTLKGGLEILTSENGKVSFMTPLATLHKFNGWADMFLTTPQKGLQDFYTSLNYVLLNTKSEFDGLNFMFVYHQFKADFEKINYGSEIDFSISKVILKQYNVLLKYTRYNAVNYLSDTSKFWVQVGTKF